VVESSKRPREERHAAESCLHKAVGMQVVTEALALYSFGDTRNGDGG
jgi:hypothetical protein